MFDDLKKDQNQASGQPLKKIDDMFAEVDPTPSDQPSVSRPISEASNSPSFEQRPSALGSGRIKPISPNQNFPLADQPVADQTQSAPTVADPEPANSAPVMPVAENIEGMSSKQKVTIIVSVFFLLLIAGGAFYYFLFRSDFILDENGNGEENINNNTVNENININTNEEIIIDPIDIDDDRFLDSDLDGLSDADERALGTNPYDPDTDNDGVSDYDEVRIYRTNPLLADTDGDSLTDYEEIFIYGTDPNNPDTDGDGYSDGVEVANGYNPLGPGLLDEMLVMPIPLPASFWEQVPDDFFFRPMSNIEQALERYISTGRLY